MYYIYFSVYFLVSEIAVMLVIKNHPLGASINDITALGGRGYEGFCDNSIKGLVLEV
jgi:hypothetical protein